MAPVPTGTTRYPNLYDALYGDTRQPTVRPWDLETDKSVVRSLPIEVKQLARVALERVLWNKCTCTPMQWRAVITAQREAYQETDEPTKCKHNRGLVARTLVYSNEWCGLPCLAYNAVAGHLV